MENVDIQLKNIFLYNGGAELEDWITYYDTFYRKYDTQTKIFTGIDMMAESYTGLNPYQFAANNPVMFNDPMGDQLGALGDEYRSRKGSDKNYHTGWVSDMMNGYFSTGEWEGGFNTGGGGSFSGFGSLTAGGSYFSNLLSSLSKGGFDGFNEGHYIFANGLPQYFGPEEVFVIGNFKNGEWATDHSTYSGFEKQNGVLDYIWADLKASYTNYLDPGMVWVNKNINPVTPFAELITGKEYTSQGLTGEKSRMTSLGQAALGVIPIGRVIGVGDRVITNSIVRSPSVLGH